MKLAEALMKRADCFRKIEELKERIIRNAKYQEGESASEDPHDLLTEYESTVAEFESLIVQINITNNRTSLSRGRVGPSLIS